jgi:ornithine cyclodeaminase/alanine dehydrogenase
MTELPPKSWLHHKTRDSFFSSMPCLFRRLNLVGCKWQSGFPTNGKRGLPYIIGLVIVNDIETGYPLAIMDSSWIVAMRTAAATAVATKYYSRQDSNKLAILGCGIQGRKHAESILNIRPEIDEIEAFDINLHFRHIIQKNKSLYFVKASQIMFSH